MWVFVIFFRTWSLHAPLTNYISYPRCRRESFKTASLVRSPSVTVLFDHAVIMYDCTVCAVKRQKFDSDKSAQNEAKFNRQVDAETIKLTTQVGRASDTVILAHCQSMSKIETRRNTAVFQLIHMTGLLSSSVHRRLHLHCVYEKMRPLNNLL